MMESHHSDSQHQQTLSVDSNVIDNGLANHLPICQSYTDMEESLRAQHRHSRFKHSLLHWFYRRFIQLPPSDSRIDHDHSIHTMTTTTTDSPCSSSPSSWQLFNIIIIIFFLFFFIFGLFLYLMILFSKYTSLVFSLAIFIVLIIPMLLNFIPLIPNYGEKLMDAINYIPLLFLPMKLYQGVFTLNTSQVILSIVLILILIIIDVFYTVNKNV